MHKVIKLVTKHHGCKSTQPTHMGSWNSIGQPLDARPLEFYRIYEPNIPVSSAIAFDSMANARDFGRHWRLNNYFDAFWEAEAEEIWPIEYILEYGYSSAEELRYYERMNGQVHPTRIPLHPFKAPRGSLFCRGLAITKRIPWEAFGAVNHGYR